MDNAVVAFFVGSKSDIGKIAEAKKFFDDMRIPYVTHITSAHRTPGRTNNWTKSLEKEGCKIFICAAGMAAHLAGAVKAWTSKPVIGLPLTSGRSPLHGMDALFSTVQMPSGMPVATVGIDMDKNAAILAAEILALSNPEIADKLMAMRANMTTDVIKDDDDMNEGPNAPIA